MTRMFGRLAAAFEVQAAKEAARAAARNRRNDMA
jgi:hypothetical protein